MAASSPSLSINSTDNHPVITTIYPAAATITSTNASKNLRGLNKPKCIKCGNVARSRCPYQSCKSCCAKAQNPCHIHVLKGNSTLPDKASSTGSPLFDQQSTDVSPSGNSHRVASLRQLSSNFSQFNNLQSPLRSRRPLTRKEAGVINEWRYLKLKEYKDRNIEAENEAFDRYMQNVTSLEKVFSLNSLEGHMKDDGSPISNPNPTSAEDSSVMAIAEMKLKLRSNPIRAENFRNRIQYIVDRGLRKLQKIELNDVGADLNEQQLFKRPKKKKSWRAERVDILTDLIDKLNKARNEEDLKSCLEMKAQLFNWHNKSSQVESEDSGTPKDPALQCGASFKLQSDYSPPMWFSTTTIHQEVLNCIDAHFATLEEIEDL